MNLKEFGVYFAEIREKSGYRSQRELADKSGVSHSTINRIEAGTNKANVDTLKALAPHLRGTTIEELLSKAGVIDEPSPAAGPSIAYFGGAITEEEKEFLDEQLEIFRIRKAIREQEKKNNE
jgi:transcriptional regulator with XRE-family HTH domain